MKFVNTATHDLRFDLDGKLYEVPVGASCDVPDRISYAVQSRGLPMKPVDAESPRVSAPAPVAEEMSEADLEAATAPSQSRKRK